MASTEIKDRNGGHPDEQSNTHVMPPHGDHRLSLFDRFATSASSFASKA